MPNAFILTNVSDLHLNISSVNQTEFNDEDYTIYNEESGDEIEDFIYTYIGPIFFIFGILANATAFITLCRPPLNNFSSSVYLAAFSFAAVLTLAFSLGLDWCYKVIDSVHFKNLSESICRLWEFFDRMIKCSGVWFVVGGVTDRFIGLWFPYKAQDMCTVFIAKVSVSISLIAVTSLNVHAMWMQDFSMFGDKTYCWVDSRDEFKLVWSWTSTLLCNIIPQSCLFILGNLLVLRMCLKHRGRRIAEIASIEMDLTYTVMIFAIVYATFSLPSSITNIMVGLNHSLKENSTFVIFSFYMNYLNWISYTCLVITLAIRSTAFRDSVKGMIVGCINVIRHGTSTVELRMITEDYDQVPSTSTTL